MYGCESQNINEYVNTPFVSDILKQELVVALSGLAIRYESKFIEVATKLTEDESGGFPMSLGPHHCNYPKDLATLVALC